MHLDLIDFSWESLTVQAQVSALSLLQPWKLHCPVSSVRAEQMNNGPCAATPLVGLTGKPATRWCCPADGGQKGRVSGPAKLSVENTPIYHSGPGKGPDLHRAVNKRRLKPRPEGANRPHQQVNGFFFKPGITFIGLSFKHTLCVSYITSFSQKPWKELAIRMTRHPGLPVVLMQILKEPFFTFQSALDGQ